MNFNETTDRRLSGLSPQHRRHLLIETGLGIVITVAANAPFVFLAFGSQGAIERWGANGFAFDFLPQTFMTALMATLALTMLTRRRVRSGMVARHSGFASGRLPHNVVLRGLVAAMAATLVFASSAILLTLVLWQGPLSFYTALWMKLVYAGLLGLVLTPLIILCALGDEASGAHFIASP